MQLTNYLVYSFDSIPNNNNNEPLYLFDVLAKLPHQYTIIEFWTKKCSLCPSILEKLNNASQYKKNCNYVACAWNDVTYLDEIIQDWDQLTHIYMQDNEKEDIKQCYSIQQVPFFIIINNKTNQIIEYGYPGKSQLFNDLTTPIQPIIQPQIAFSLFNQEDF